MPGSLRFAKPRQAARQHVQMRTGAPPLLRPEAALARTKFVTSSSDRSALVECFAWRLERLAGAQIELASIMVLHWPCSAAPLCLHALSVRNQGQNLTAMLLVKRHQFGLPFVTASSQFISPGGAKTVCRELEKASPSSNHHAPLAWCLGTHRTSPTVWHYRVFGAH